MTMLPHAAFVPAGVLAPPHPLQCLTRSARCGTGGRTAKRQRATIARMSAGKGSPAEDWRDAEFVLDGGKGLNSGANASGRADAGTGDASTDEAAGGATGAFDWEAWETARTPSEVPLLPFSPEEIFLPGESKRLHIYEARFLALFERAVVRYDKRFAHVLYAADRAALAAHGTLARIRHWRRLDVGVLVEIEGVGRLRVSALHRAAPFWAGACASVADAPADVGELRAREAAALRAFHEVVRLCVRLGASPTRAKPDSAARTVASSVGKEEVPSGPPLAGDNGVFVLNDAAKSAAWESRLRSAAARAGGGERFEWGEALLDDDVAARRARAVSFAAWDFFPSRAGERQKALEGRNTIVRLDFVVKGLEAFVKSLAARAALKDALQKDES